MKAKRALLVLMALCAALVFLGCGAKPLPEGFDKDKVTARAEEIVGYANDGDYDAIIACLRSDLAGAITADQLKEGWAATYDKVGTFDSIQSEQLTSAKDSSTEEEYAVALVACKHASGTVLYTLSFDKDLNLVGLYLK